MAIKVRASKALHPIHWDVHLVKSKDFHDMQ